MKSPFIKMIKDATQHLKHRHLGSTSSQSGGRDGYKSNIVKHLEVSVETEC